MAQRGDPNRAERIAPYMLTGGRSGTAKQAYRSRPKCPVTDGSHGDSVLCTRGSIARGTPLCYRHDPQYQKDESIAKTKKELRRLKGKRHLHIPKSIIEIYEETIVDETILCLREDIAISEARIRLMLKQIKESPYEAVGWWKHYNGVFEQQKTLLRRGTISPAEFINQIDLLRRAKVDEIMLWAEVRRESEHKRKLVETESKRLRDLGWSPEYVFAVIAEISSIAKQLMQADKFVKFHDMLESSPVFRNQVFSLVDSSDLTEKMLKAKLDELQGKTDVETELTAAGVYEPEVQRNGA